jgi:hypothetical protein
MAGYFPDSCRIVSPWQNQPANQCRKNHMNRADVVFSSLRTIKQNKDKQNTAQDNFKYERTKTKGEPVARKPIAVLPNVGRRFLLNFSSYLQFYHVISTFSLRTSGSPLYSPENGSTSL